MPKPELIAYFFCFYELLFNNTYPQHHQALKIARSYQKTHRELCERSGPRKWDSSVSVNPEVF